MLAKDTEMMYFHNVDSLIDNLNCKFDQLLSNSLNGNCLTSLICMISSNKDEVEGSVLTLKLALIAKKLRLYAFQNEVQDSYDRMIEENQSPLSINSIPSRNIQ